MRKVYASYCAKGFPMLNGLILLGCFSQQEDISTSSQSEANNEHWFYACRKYEAKSEGFGFCLYKHSETMKTIPDIKLYCSYAGKWESECIYNWVAANLAPNNGFSTEELLNLCGDIKDCAFRVLDLRPREDTLEQVELCKIHVTRNYRDCVLHAMLHWWKKEPSAEEVARLMQVPLEPSPFFGYYIASRVHCEGIGTCKGSPEMERRCLELGQEFKEKRKKCPELRKRKGEIYKVPGGANKSMTNDAMQPNLRKK